jgi:plastocyanin
MRCHPAGRLCLVAFFCIFAASSTPALAQDQNETYTAKPGQDGVQRVRIVGGEYFFKPNHIVVKVNLPVELIVTKEAGITPHNIVIEAPEAGVTVEEDLDTEAKKISFTATAVGKYPIYCSNKLLFFASHRERGMEGILEVFP